MSDSTPTETPLGQRIYDRVWLLATAALLFWLVTYVGWGILDLLSIPAGGV